MLDKVKTKFYQLGISLSTTGHRDSFAEEPEKTIRDDCQELFAVCEDMVQNAKESLLIQPALVEVVSIRKLPTDPSVKLVRSVFRNLSIMWDERVPRMPKAVKSINHTHLSHLSNTAF